MIESSDYNYFIKEDENSYPKDNTIFIFWIKDKEYPDVGRFIQSTNQVESLITSIIYSIDNFIYMYINKRPTVLEFLSYTKCIAENIHCEFYVSGNCRDYTNQLANCRNKEKSEKAHIILEDLS